MSAAIELMERGLVPDFLTRIGIRRLLAMRLRDEDRGTDSAQAEALSELIEELTSGPIALRTEAANTQHYEVPAVFFERVLGEHLKYSACYWASGNETLSQAEIAMLDLTCGRAHLSDGQRILELGCGWGSLTLWMAQHYPRARITAVSNSRSQCQYIEARCRQLGIHNVQVITADMNDFFTEQTFDRVVSVEMFEHMRNYRALLMRINSWLEPDGKLFVHIFSLHQQLMH